MPGPPCPWLLPLTLRANTEAFPGWPEDIITSVPPPHPGGTLETRQLALSGWALLRVHHPFSKVTADTVQTPTYFSFSPWGSNTDIIIIILCTFQKVAC